MSKRILGMGNAVLDILTSVSDEFLESEELEKGSMTLVDQDLSDETLTNINPIKKDSGGSVANTIAGISLLGKNCFFCGKVKNDNLGDDFILNMQNTGTKFLCKQSTKGLSTARCIVFVTPDGERSMQTFLGASTTLGKDDIETNFFDDLEFLLIEGYLWSSKSAREAIMKASKISKEKNVKIVFSLSDPNLVKMYKKEFFNFIKSNVNILIGNENEVNELFSNFDEKLATKDLNVELIVVTKGKDGVKVIENEEIHNVSAVKVKSVVDTTGAGDMFAAGFLFQLLNGRKAKDAAVFGCQTASLIIQQYGARPTEEILSFLK
jgi:sugar/nucleoside kinase (ribokinase family)